MNRLITRLQRRSRVAVGSTMAMIVSLPLGATIGLASTATAAPSPEPAAATDTQAKKAPQGTGKAGTAETASTLGDAVPWTADPKRLRRRGRGGVVRRAALLQDGCVPRTPTSTRPPPPSRRSAPTNNFTVTATEDSSAFNDANLEQYEVVIFLSTTGDVLNPTEQAAFERYIQAGGGYAGIHAASDTEYDWPWYGSLVGAYFNNHPPGTPTATVKVEDPAHPSTAGIAARAGSAPTSGTTSAPTRRPTPAPSSTCWRRWTRPPTPRAPARWAPSTRSPGARTTTVAAAGTPAWVTPRRPSPTPPFLGHILGGIQTAAGVVRLGLQGDPDAQLREGGPRREHLQPDGARHRRRRSGVLHRPQRRRAHHPGERQRA